VKVYSTVKVIFFLTHLCLAMASWGKTSSTVPFEQIRNPAYSLLWKRLSPLFLRLILLLWPACREPQQLQWILVLYKRLVQMLVLVPFWLLRWPLTSHLPAWLYRLSAYRQTTLRHQSSGWVLRRGLHLCQPLSAPQWASLLSLGLLVIRLWTISIPYNPAP